MPQYFKRALRIVAYVICLLVPFLIDHSVTLSRDHCKPRTLEPGSLEGFAESVIYRAFTNSGYHKLRSRSTAVVLLRDRSLPDELFSNKCLQRRYMASLIAQVSNHAPVIVVDKSFSDTSCSDPTATAILVQALSAATARSDVVVSLSTDTELDFERHQINLSDDQWQQFRRACLVLSPHINFRELISSARFHQGLIRADPDIRRIPLSWLTFESFPTAEQPKNYESTSTIAAKARDPSLKRSKVLEKYIDSRTHPLTSFINQSDEDRKIPTVSAADLICQQNHSEQRYGECPNASEALKLLDGRVVLIGDDTQQDRHLTPVGELPGVIVVANYIESLLDDRYFSTSPIWFELLAAFGWVITIEYCFSKYKDRKPETLAVRLAAWMFAFLFISWTSYQIGGLLVFFGVPGALISLFLRYIDEIRERAKAFVP